jgi:hypothetical protein
LEHTHRPALEDHVHRPTRLGSSRSLKLRIGISGNNYLAFGNVADELGNGS